MNFNEEEIKVFELDKKEILNPINCILPHLMNIYLTDNDEQEKYNINVTLNFIKRMIIKISKKRGYDIVGNEYFDTDTLLNEIIKVPKEREKEFLGFYPLLYKNEEKMNNYFYLKTKDLSIIELDCFIRSFELLVNDNLRIYLNENIDKILKTIVEIYYELEANDEESNNENNSIISNNNEYLNPDETPLISNDFDDWESDNECMNEINNSYKENTQNITLLDKETLINCIKFINVIDELNKYRKLGSSVINNLLNLKKQKKLELFYSNEEFIKKLDQIMEHDTQYSSYYYHGTQCLGDAKTILDEGLGMTQDDLRSTSYKEFTRNKVLLYENGFVGEIGQEAIVIVEVPKNINGEELNIVTKLDSNKKIHFCPSGMQGLNRGPNYIVLPENIVGYIDKRNMQVVYNPKYRNYKQITAKNQPKKLTKSLKNI